MNNRIYDLDKRTLQFAIDVRKLIAKIPRSFLNENDLKQLLRSSGSVAANYAEANEAGSKKDFSHKCTICRKEAKESWVWLHTLEPCIPKNLQIEHSRLIQESLELTKIFRSIIQKMYK